MKKSSLLLMAASLAFAAFFFAGCELKEVQVDTIDEGGGSGGEKTPSAIYADLLSEASDDIDGAVAINGDTITIKKSFTLNKTLTMALPKGVSLNIGDTQADNTQANSVRAEEADSEPVTLTLADGVSFEVGQGTLTLKGAIKVGTGVFGLGHGIVQLYGTLDMGTGRIASDVKDEGKLAIYPGAVLKDFATGIERELVGSNSLSLGPGAILELKGEYGPNDNDFRTRQFTLSGGTATVKSDMGIFNNGGIWRETITLKQGAGFAIDGGGGGTAVMHIVGTEATLETLSNYIIGSEGGTISALNGGSLVSDYSQTSVIIPAGSSAGWGSIASAWQLIAGEEDLKE